MWRGKAMQQAQALVKERSESKKAHRHLAKVKEGKQPKEQVEGEEEKGGSQSVLGWWAASITSLPAAMARGLAMG